jgi:recombination protein RecA
MAFAKKKEEAPKQPAPKVEIPATHAERLSALFALSKVLDKKHETTNTLVSLGKRVGIAVPSISTGCPSMDNEVLGCGGVPRGRIIEIFGPESAGKTTEALHIIAQEQKAGGLVAFVDAEHALDPTYARYLGVKVEELLVSQPDSGEQALDTLIELVKSRLITLAVVDSVAALVPEAELAGELTDQNPGLHARLMSKAMRQLCGLCARTNIPVIFINQIREKIGVMFGNPETTTGGRALKFYASIRLDVRRREAIKDGDKIIGHQLELKAVKNKVATPFRSTVLDLYYPGLGIAPGIDVVGDMIKYASDHGMFEMKGSWYWLDLGNVDPKGKPLGPEQLANGLKNLKITIRDDEKVMNILKKKVADKLASELVAAPKPETAL